MSQLPYPRPGTHAEAALDHIRTNPGCSQNSVTKLVGNVAKAIHVIARLTEHGLITATVDERGHRALWPAAN